MQNLHKLGIFLTKSKNLKRQNKFGKNIIYI